MFKVYTVNVLLLVAFASGAPYHPHIQILRYDNSNNGPGTYNYAYAGADGLNTQTQMYWNNWGPQAAPKQPQEAYLVVAPAAVSYVEDQNRLRGGYRENYAGQYSGFYNRGYAL